jgi:hypothetical protein
MARTTIQRQSRSRRPTTNAGLGVDAMGGPVIDPTENVLSLVDVQATHAKELRSADERRYTDLRTADQRYQNDIRRAENQRLNDLAKLKANYDKQIADMLSVQVKTTSDLISTQLDKVTTALGAQITTLTATLNDRIAQLERFRYEMGGKTSVSDPATASALVEMANAIKLLRTTDDTHAGKGLGRSEIYAIIIVAIAAAGLFLGLHK